MTKQAYLDNYEDFVLKVKGNYRHFTTEEWTGNDETFRQYSVVLFDKFRDRLTQQELVRMKALSVRYRLYRCAGGMLSSIKDLYSQDQREMINELMALIKDASDIGMELSKEIDNQVIQKIITDIEKSYHENFEQ